MQRSNQGCLPHPLSQTVKFHQRVGNLGTPDVGDISKPILHRLDQSVQRLDNPTWLFDNLVYVYR